MAAVPSGQTTRWQATPCGWARNWHGAELTMSEYVPGDICAGKCEVATAVPSF